MGQSWEKIGNQALFKHPRLNLSEDRVRLPGGQETNYLLYDGYPDYATIIATQADGQILMLREYAYPVDQILLQFPEGDSQPGETVQVAAARELVEEAGLKAQKLTTIGYNLHHHRRSTARNVIILAENLGPARAQGDTEELGITCHWFTEREIWQKIVAGEIVQKNTLAAWAIFQAHYR